MGLFNINGGFAKFMNKLLDVFWLNILWIICSLPIVTIGASTCAAYYVALKMVDDEEGYVGKMFFKAFKQDFKQGTIMWCITAPCCYLLYLAWQVAVKADNSTLAIIGCIIVTVIVVTTNLYTYPLIARYENTLKMMIRNSFGISLQYFGKTIFIAAIVAVEVFLILWNNWTLLAGILIGPIVIIYTVAGMVKKIFVRIESQKDEGSGTING